MCVSLIQAYIFGSDLDLTLNLYDNIQQTTDTDQNS